jgi:hypothetical protein
LTAESAFCTDFSSEECDLTGKFLKLIHHGVDGALEQCDFRVHLLSMDQNLFAQITHSDSCDDGTDFPQCFLESQVGWDVLACGRHISEGTQHTLLMLAQFTFQCAYVLNAVFKYHALCCQLLVHFLAQVVCGVLVDLHLNSAYEHEHTNVLALILNLVRLLIQVYTQVIELLFRQSRSGLL